MPLFNLRKALLPICWNGPAELIARKIANSSVSHAIFHIKGSEDYEQIVKKAEKPIIVSFYDPTSPKSKLQYERLKEVMKQKQKVIDLAHVDVTIARISEQIEPTDLLAVPLLAVFDSGKIVRRLSGSHSKVYLRGWVDKAYSQAHFKIKHEF